MSSPEAAVQAVLCDVLAERRRQLEAGYSAPHDDSHRAGELALAAAARAHASTCNTAELDHDLILAALDPWPGGWRAASRRQLLVEAAALLVAEIERLDRAAAPLREALDIDGRG